ncbi:MAG TPA: thymidine kinase [Holophaga sp.]|nr:thymidine kinase [Holophaga sp.]
MTVFFRYGAMNAGKSIQVLTVRYNYQERHQSVFLYKPSVDTRDGANLIHARIGLDAPVDDLIKPDTDIFQLFEGTLARQGRPACILVDEAQFLSRGQVEQFCDLSDQTGIPVMCFGLRADFRGELFPGSAALMALADRIEELKTICWCGKKATMNARIIDGKVVLEGPQILIGGNDSYTALCRKHWKEGVHTPPGQA